MTNPEILEKVREAERLIIQALRLMHEIRIATATAENKRAIQRRDACDCAELITHLFRLVEPHYTEADPTTWVPPIEMVESDWCPRGILGNFRLRYEVMCGIRAQSGGVYSWLFPKV
jgi:hypothetical protein